MPLPGRLAASVVTQQGLSVHASEQGTHAAAGAPCSHRCGAQQGLRVHASSQGTQAAAGAARRNRYGVNQTQNVAIITWWEVIILAEFAGDSRDA